MMQNTITIHNNEIRYFHSEQKTSDTLILCLHGLGCSKNVFKFIENSELYNEFNILIPDLVGFGNSISSSDFSFKMKDQAEIINELLSQFEYENLIIIAHSMGGAIALHLNQNVINKVKFFFNLEGNLIGDDCGMFSRTIAEYGLNKYKNEIFPLHQKELKDHHELDFSKVTAETIFFSSLDLVNESDCGNLLTKFNKLSCDKYYIWGEQNHKMKILQQLNDIKKIMIPNSGHDMLTTYPEVVYKKIQTHLLKYKI
jgi:pimeloyl-ACP methyl ester carboxylesterase